MPDVEEDGRTFAENAAKKASQVARQLNRWVIGEDSGLMVDALNGAPGIYSARYSGAGGDRRKEQCETDCGTRWLFLMKNVVPGTFAAWPFPILPARFVSPVKERVAVEFSAERTATVDSVMIRIF